MAFSRFEVGLAWRTVVLVLAVWLLVEASAAAHLRAGRLVAALIAFAALANLWAFIRRTNFQVARFIESVRFEDYSQRFSTPAAAASTFSEKPSTLRSRGSRSAMSARRERRDFCRRSLTTAQAPCLRSTRDGRVEMLNKAARQLFGRIGLSRVTDLAALGPELAAAAQLPPGSRKITRLLIDGVPHRAIFASAHVARLEGGVTVLSILPFRRSSVLSRLPPRLTWCGS
jgi:hypothetical protein